jgi:hypothetical protein
MTIYMFGLNESSLIVTCSISAAHRKTISQRINSRKQIWDIQIQWVLDIADVLSTIMMFLDCIGFKYWSARRSRCLSDGSGGGGCLRLLSLCVCALSSPASTGLDAVTPVGSIASLSGCAGSPRRSGAILSSNLVFLIIVLAESL